MRKKVLSFMLAAVLSVGLAAPAASVEAAAKVKISSKKITLKVGEKKTLTVKKGSKKVKGVKWSTNNKKVATVKAGKVTAKKKGTAVITAKVNSKKYTCKVTVKAKAKATTEKKIPVTTSTEKPTPVTPSTEKPTSVTPSTEKPTPVTPSTEKQTPETPSPEKQTPETPSEEKDTPSSGTTPNASDFSFKDDVKIKYGTKIVHVDFDVKKTGGEMDPQEVEELKELGFTIDEDKGTASKDQVCETATYTFSKLPTTTADIESFFAEEEPEFKDDNYGELNYGGFNAMAATICAACTFKGGSNPSDPFFSKDPVREMFEYINGPADSMNIAKSQMDNAISSMKSAIQACGENVYKSYFNGATSKNNYTPDEPYVLELYKGPYYIESKQTINGTRPTTYMILVKSGGAEAERYIDVYYSSKAGRWFSYENQFMHITANEFQQPEEEL